MFVSVFRAVLKKSRCCGVLVVLSFGVQANEGSSSVLTLDHVLAQVKQHDFRLQQLSIEAQAYASEAKAAEYLPDPSLFAAIQNLPSDSFKFDQEPMTQLKLGLRQMFPQGETLEIQSSMAELNAQVQRSAREERWLSRKKQVEQTWLEAWYWQKNTALLMQDRVFLTQVLDFIRSLYEVGARDQSDLLGAELALIKLEERLIESQRFYRDYRQQLNTQANSVLSDDMLMPELPKLSVSSDEKLSSLFQDGVSLQAQLVQHPRIALLEQAIALAQEKVAEKEAAFAPQWGLELSVGLRDGENMDGSERPDFFSAGVTMQMPLFSAQKQGHQLSASKLRVGAAQSRRDEALSEMRFEAENLWQQYTSTAAQAALYQESLLPTLNNQRASAVQAYEADRGNFAQVMALYLKTQSAQAMHQRLRVNAQKLISSINYLLSASSDSASEGVHEQ